ncbi:hypothetical protein [Streptacidiphilus carbonis]|uniref:hypothetical protein n=1 Tax=Streptacidiphilus carbonis TaxID=105422 RepID=UPI0005A76D0B|nr:hypothetical protein [Streptacidiphilus carbonis]
MRTTTLTATALVAGTALAAAWHRTRYRLPALAPVDRSLAPAGARRLADLLELGDPITTGLATDGSNILGVPAGLVDVLAGFADPDNLAGSLPCPALREGVGHLHDWLGWGAANDVLEALRDQAPIGPIADLLADLGIDLGHGSPDDQATAAQLRVAETSLRSAAVRLGEVDYEAPWTDPHPDDCPGGCIGTGELDRSDESGPTVPCPGRRPIPAVPPF